SCRTPAGAALTGSRVLLLLWAVVRGPVVHTGGLVRGTVHTGLRSDRVLQHGVLGEADLHLGRALQFLVELVDERLGRWRGLGVRRLGRVLRGLGPSGLPVLGTRTRCGVQRGTKVIEV